ncbi:hypothetical protein DUNSADRAFT_8696 [Dunaliella salina]|uniref:Encoded protein n=1 Tax=Dunaliella salina TaxID=3046 RepID=A0ABQ7GJ34_DUNSA|nr:hypothetical protein DUNSADRAFT_8696 [Dunaliella salina]|eukprot:KAF5834612.1 hypothetical protein DUNSADRAFT_8696 [Dunaliella salina]
MIRRLLEEVRGIEIPLIVCMLLMIAGGIISIRYMMRASARDSRQKARLRVQRESTGAAEDGPKHRQRRRQLA